MKNAQLFLLLIILSCNSKSDIKSIKPIEKVILKGTQWSSDFYYYHNDYFFLTDSTGFSRDGQYLWSTPVDPVLYNNSSDSIIFFNREFFTYSLNDTLLRICYTPLQSNSLHKIEDRVFIAEKGDSNSVVFRSEHEYSYGKEYLILNTLKKNVNQ
ncbi:MAG: hypothetical protein IM638_19240 [Bacteroidetes bacterium]|nr:hypothetical protein [Bacteroidota bacterium]